jgi:hypothetical protein
MIAYIIPSLKRGGSFKLFIPINIFSAANVTFLVFQKQPLILYFTLLYFTLSLDPFYYFYYCRQNLRLTDPIRMPCLAHTVVL